jgi:hypothetical protein
MKKFFDELTSTPRGSGVDYEYRPREFTNVTYNKDIDLDAIVDKYNLAGVRDFITYNRNIDTIIRSFETKELESEKKCAILSQENERLKDHLRASTKLFDELKDFICRLKK